MRTSLLLQCSLILYDDSLLLRAICRGIGKAETMVYGRYENGQRAPSYPTVGFIAQTFNCNIDYLYGTSDKTDPDYIIVSSSNDPKLLFTHQNDQAGQQCRRQNTYICTQAIRKINYHDKLSRRETQFTH